MKKSTIIIALIIISLILVILKAFHVINLPGFILFIPMDLGIILLIYCGIKFICEILHPSYNTNYGMGDDDEKKK